MVTDTQFKPGDDVQLRNGWEAEVLDVVAEAAQAYLIVNTVIESRLSDELEDIERDVNAQEDAEAALRKALEELK